MKKLSFLVALLLIILVAFPVHADRTPLHRIQKIHAGADTYVPTHQSNYDTIDRRLPLVRSSGNRPSAGYLSDDVLLIDKTVKRIYRWDTGTSSWTPIADLTDDTGITPSSVDADTAVFDTATINFQLDLTSGSLLNTEWSSSDLDNFPQEIAGNGLKQTAPATMGVEPSDFASTGLGDDGSDNLAIQSDAIDLSLLDETISPIWESTHTWNTAGGPDLILDENGFSYTSSTDQTFTLSNTGSGGALFSVDGGTLADVSAFTDSYNAVTDLEIDTSLAYGWTGTHDFSSGDLTLPTASSPSQTTEGRAVWDSDDDKLTIGDGSSRQIMVRESRTLTGGNAIDSIGDLSTDRTIAVSSGGIQTDELDLSISPTWTGLHIFDQGIGVRTGADNTTDAGIQLGPDTNTTADLMGNSTIASVGATGSGRLYLEGQNQADIILDDSAAPTDEKLVQIANNDGTTELRAITDAGGVGSSFWSVSNSNGNMTIGSDLIQNGTTIWDASVPEIPDSAMGTIENSTLANSCVTVAGNSVCLGSSTAVDHADLSNVTSDQHHPQINTSDDGVGVVDGPSDINFGDSLSVNNDGDGTITVNSTASGGSPLNEAAKMTQTSMDTIASASLERIPFDSVDYDSTARVTADPSINGFSVNESGLYGINLQITWNQNAGWSTGDDIDHIIQVNSSDEAVFDRVKVSTSQEGFSYQTTRLLNNGDTVGVQVFHQSGGDRRTNPDGKTFIEVIPR